ncbi:MAG: VOC family protein [Erythrobacter sp.]|nr:VOC family protein [Erythrobacter sp.]
MFTSVTPVCPVSDMQRTLQFWQTLGFELSFVDNSDPKAAAYCGVRRGALEIHLQAFTTDQLRFTQTMALRVWMESREKLDALAEEWAPHNVISAPLADRPWGNREFGLYDPDKTPFFFCVDI